MSISHATRAFAASLLLLATAASAATVPAQGRVVLKGLVCSYCAQGLVKGMRALPELESVEVRLKEHDALFTLKPGARLEEAALRKIAQDAGLEIETIEPASQTKILAPTLPST